MTKRLLTVAISAVLVSACGSDKKDNPTTKAPENKSPLATLNIQCADVTKATAKTETGKLQLSLVDTHVSGNEFDTASAEIVSYDSCSDRLYVVNAKDATVDVLSLAQNNSAPSKDKTINLQAAAQEAKVELGAANSVSAKQGLVAVAIEAKNKQDNGIIALYRSDDLALLGTYQAGALPDMVTLSEDGRYILSANEGEPSSNYKNDPEGSVTIVDLKNGFSTDKAMVKQVRFNEFNTGASRASELDAQVRISGPQGTSVAQDLEPEYLTLNKAGSKAYVVLQENNAIAIIDVASGKIDAIKGLGEKSWANIKLDASNKDGVGLDKLQSYPGLAGLYMPDTITSFEKDGKTYLVTANEGDGREYFFAATEAECTQAKGILWDKKDGCLSHIDESAAKDFDDFKVSVADDHALKAALDDKNQLQRLKLVIKPNQTIKKGETLYTFGGRSFTIWNDQAELVFDSGDDFAKRILADNDNADNFNATNDSNLTAETADNRSDNKGSEPEAVEVASINNRLFAFISLERQGGIMVYDISNPQQPVFQSYLNNRDFSQPVCTEVDKDGECDNKTYNSAAKDLGPESIDYFSREGKHFIAVGNEVSGTTSVFEIRFN